MVDRGRVLSAKAVFRDRFVVSRSTIKGDIAALFATYADRAIAVAVRQKSRHPHSAGATPVPMVA